LKKQGVVAALLYRVLSGQPFEIWGTGEVTRDFIHVDDVASAFLHALHYTGEHRIMNVGSGEGRSINRIVADLQEVLGIPSLEVVRKPDRAADVPISVLDNSVIRRETSWRPRVSWIDGLRETAAWMRTSYAL
jgi:UDP-glucose 4-epimerase